MIDDYHLITPADKPALLALSTPEWLEMARNVLTDLGYKTLTVQSHEEFAARFEQVRFQVIIIQDFFGGTPPDQNFTLQNLQRMPMNRRRHAVVILVGEGCATLDTLQAFQQSVHGVVNYSDMPILAHVVQKSVAENNLFLNTFREAQKNIAQSQD